MEEYFISSTNLSYFFDGLNHTDLIVHHYYGDYDGIRSYSLLQLLKINQPVSLNGQVCHIETLFF